MLTEISFIQVAFTWVSQSGYPGTLPIHDFFKPNFYFVGSGLIQEVWILVLDMLQHILVVWTYYQYTISLNQIFIAYYWGLFRKYELNSSLGHARKYIGHEELVFSFCLFLCYLDSNIKHKYPSFLHVYLFSFMYLLLFFEKIISLFF